MIYIYMIYIYIVISPKTKTYDHGTMQQTQDASFLLVMFKQYPTKTNKVEGKSNLTLNPCSSMVLNIFKHFVSFY